MSQINLNDIERIEIVEGPLSVNYGTDALAGTINLITRKTNKEKLQVSLNSYYETVGQYNLDAGMQYRLGKHQLSVSGGRNYFDGWSTGDPFVEFPRPSLADSNRAKGWNPKEQYFGRAQYRYQTANASLRAYARGFRETINDRGLPRRPYYETAFDDQYRTWRNDAGLEASLAPTPVLNLRVLAAYNHYKRIKNTYFKDLTTLQQRLVEEASSQDTSAFSLWMSRGKLSTTRSNAKINYEVGYDINYEMAHGQRIAGKQQQMGDYALFTSAEIRIGEHGLIRPGLRYAYNTTYNAPLVSSLNLKYALPTKKGDRWSMRASYARGFRAPSLKDIVH